MGGGVSYMMTEILLTTVSCPSKRLTEILKVPLGTLLSARSSIVRPLIFSSYVINSAVFSKDTISVTLSSGSKSE